MKVRLLRAPLLLLTIAGCSHQPQIKPVQAGPVQAPVFTVASTVRRGTLSLTGSLASRQVADISAQIMAPISQVRVREGDIVRRGEVLVRLSSPVLAAGLRQAEAQVASAQKQASATEAQSSLARDTYSRYELLNQRHSVTPHEFDQVKAQLAAAQAQQQAAEAQVRAAQAAQLQSRATQAYTVITAPFSGVVSARYLDPGSMAAPGAPILRVENSQQLDLNLQVSESSLRDVHLGENVEVRSSQTPGPLEGRVREIVPAGDPAAHTFTVKIGLPAVRGMYTGMTASAQIPTAEQAAVTVPRASILQRGQMDAVIALDHEFVAQIRYVSLGRSFGEDVEILSGLQPGDRVLAAPDSVLLGRRIEPRS